jgi:hypothetical protein
MYGDYMYDNSYWYDPGNYYWVIATPDDNYSETGMITGSLWDTSIQVRFKKINKF